MSRAIAVTSLAIALTLCAVMISGCSEEKLEDTPVYNYSMPAYGHVYLDGKAVSGTLVSAVSVDGACRTSNVTNDSGTYTLYLVPWVQYNVTATYQGLKQTIWPVKLHNLTPEYFINEDIADRYDINLSMARKATMTGITSIYGGNLFIVATPADGSAPLTAVPGPGQTYTLDLKPGVWYDFRGKFRDYYGQEGFTQFRYRNDNYCTGIAVTQGETALVDIGAFRPHPPKSLYLNLRDWPITSKPILPTTITGYVYLEGKDVKGATVEAVDLERSSRTATITNDSGGYTLGLNTTTLYRIIATSQGLQHSILPVFFESTATGAYDINLTMIPTSGITGRPPGNEPWLARPGVSIEAVPQYGGKTVKTVTGADLSYSLDLEPDTYYNLTGQFRDSNGIYHAIEFKSGVGGWMSDVMVRPNETVIVDYFTSKAYD